MAKTKIIKKQNRLTIKELVKEADKSINVSKVIESKIPQSSKIWLLHLTGMTADSIDKKLDCNRASWIINHYQLEKQKANLAVKRYNKLS